MIPGTGRVRLLRAGETESEHRVHAVIVGHEPGEEIQFGDPSRLAYWRSSFKPFQALPLVEDGVAEALGLESRELALCASSHAGRPEHVRLAASILERAGLSEADLECGTHPPYDDEAAREVLRSGESYGPLHNNCSGKHAGMLALAVHHGWATAGYIEPGHPVQARIRRALAPWLDVDPETLAWGRDGCGVPTAYLSLRQMARAYARLGRAAAEGSDAPVAIVGAMRTHPELVSGPGRPTTRVMRATGGRLLAKEGAEGVFCAASPSDGWGLALKVADGAARAAGPALVAALEAAGLLDAGELGALEPLRNPPLRNVSGVEVGRLLPELEPARQAVSGGP
ncbi:MAG TPA: asparaginase [Gemmatimonadota bacterium]|nr:asparaginase [Gemmatimonadota bacterium]